MTFVAARAGEARVWSYFSKWSNIEGFEDKYYDYAGGWNLTNRMPWSVEPREKLHVSYFLKFLYRFNSYFYCINAKKSRIIKFQQQEEIMAMN